MGDPVIAIGIIVVLIALVWLLIRGVLSISSRDKSDEDDAGVGVLEGIDEDDDKPKRR
jgi:flagellar biosynthesis/type III secretory pathway M-ring protein FliF/YscJ